MITINLKPGARRGKSGPGLGDALGRLKELPGRLKGIKDPWPMAAIAVCGGVALVLLWIWIGSARSLGKLEAELALKRSESQVNQSALVTRRKAAAARDSVLLQIATIRAVDGDRYVWPHVLDEITRALPPYTWLTDVSPIVPATVDSSAVALPPVGVQLNGRTMDISAFTRFMRQLEDSPWLRDVTIVSTGTEVDHGRAVTVFTLKVSYVRQQAAAPTLKEN